MKRIAFLLVVAASSSLAHADSSKAAIKADFENVCNAVERSGASKVKTRSEQANLISTWLHGHLKTPEVKKFLRELIGPDLGGKLKKAAADAGYTGACPMADG
jgi:hypothetical protein